MYLIFSWIEFPLSVLSCLFALAHSRHSTLNLCWAHDTFFCIRLAATFVILVSIFSNIESLRCLRVDQGLVNNHAQMQITMLWVCLGAGSTSSGQFSPDTPLILVPKYETVTWSWSGNAGVTLHCQFSYIICMTSTTNLCTSLSKEVIKHPFATCFGHHSCCLFVLFACIH